MRRIKKKIKGFTLLEIMIVIGIMATLLTILVPAMGHARYQAQLSVCMEQLKNYATAVETYSIEANYQGPPADPLLLVPGYLHSIPMEPVCRHAYTYESDLNAKNFTVTCPGQNHALCGVPAYHPYYTPATGQEMGLGH